MDTMPPPVSCLSVPRNCLLNKFGWHVTDSWAVRTEHELGLLVVVTLEDMEFN